MGDNYPTDIWITKLFPGWHDPCPLEPNFMVDGLKTEWPNRTFVNPPYSNPTPWVEKAVRTNRDMGHTIVMLLKHDSSTIWWSILHEAGARFLPIMGRLKHGTTRSAPFPSVLCVLEGTQ